MNARKLLALLALMVPAISVSAQLNISRAEEQEVQRLLALPDLTMRFQAAPLDDVLRTLCEASDMAFIGLPKPKEAVSVDMTIKGNPYQALLLVAQTYGYVPLYENGLWHFSPMKEERSKLYPKVYALKNIHVSDVNVNQKSMNDAAGRDTSSALPQPVNSAAFTTDISKVITDIKALLELDPTSLALNEKDAAIPQNPASMLLSGVPSSELATRLGNQTVKQESLKGRIIADPDQNSLFIIATKEHHLWIDTYLKAIDVQRKLILLETRFIEVSKDPTSTIGVDWDDSYTVTATNKDSKTSSSSSSSSTVVTGTTPSVTNTVTNSITNTTNAATGLLSTSIDKAILSGPELTATLNLIATDSSSRLLQHPSQVTVNNRQVVLRNVYQYPFSSGSSSSSSGGSSSTTEETQYVPIGTTVSLLPRLLDGNNIELNIMINVSGMINEKVDVGTGTAPETSSRDYSGQAIVGSGNTLAIGGLDVMSDSDSSSKVPVLGDIPLLGFLFRSEAKKETKSHLVMFITASALDGYTGNGGIKSASGVTDMLSELDKELEARGNDDVEKTDGSTSAETKAAKKSSTKKKYLLK